MRIPFIGTMNEVRMKLESIEELRLFAQIVESGSLAAAARALKLPTSTVSRRLGQLEARTGRTLLYRTTRSLSLAEDGQLLLDGVRRILEQVDATETDLERSAERLSGVVKLGVPSVLTRDLLEALAPLLREHPALRVQLSVHDRQVNPVAAGLDLVVVGGGLSDSTLISRRIGQVERVLAASPSYLQRRGRPQTPEDLAQHDTLHFLMDQPTTAWVLYDAEEQATEVPVPVRFEASDGRALLDAAVAGLGIAALSPRLLRGTPELERILPGHAFRPFPLSVVYPVSGRRSARLRAVVDALQTALSR